MNKTKSILLILVIVINACKQKTKSEVDFFPDKKPIDTIKQYKRIGINYKISDDIIEENEVYISKKNDTFWNQYKIYNKGILDSTKSKFFDFKLEGLKKDSILKGKIIFFSPADSIPQERVQSRDVYFFYQQKIGDSIGFKKIKTDKNVIEFDYKIYGDLVFVGYINDFRIIEIDSLAKEDKVLINRNYFAIDSEIYTNNPFVKLLK